MNELRNHLDILFKNAPRTRKTFEFKEELLANLEDHYEDLQSKGIPQEQAFLDVVHSIGNIEELFPDFEDKVSSQHEEQQLQNKKQAVIMTTVVALYMCCASLFLLCLISGIPYEGAVMMLILSILPTCLLVYNAQRYPKYIRQDNTIIEDMRAFKYNTKKSKEVKKAISAILWLLTFIVYFLISFTTAAWHISWIIFLVAACIQTIIRLIIVLKENES